jgi:hypothetical protein
LKSWYCLSSQGLPYFSQNSQFQHHVDESPNVVMWTALNIQKTSHMRNKRWYCSETAE